MHCLPQRGIAACETSVRLVRRSLEEAVQSTSQLHPRSGRRPENLWLAVEHADAQEREQLPHPTGVLSAVTAFNCSGKLAIWRREARPHDQRTGRAGSRQPPTAVSSTKPSLQSRLTDGAPSERHPHH